MTVLGARERPGVLRVLGGEVAGLQVGIVHKRPFIQITDCSAAVKKDGGSIGANPSISKIHCLGGESRLSRYHCEKGGGGEAKCIHTWTCIHTSEHKKLTSGVGESLFTVSPFVPFYFVHCIWYYGETVIKKWKQNTVPLDITHI